MATADTQFVSDNAGFNASGILASHFINNVPCQDGLAMKFSMNGWSRLLPSLPSLANHISNIVSLSASKEMHGSKARAVVAVVANLQIIGNSTVGHLVSGPMNKFAIPFVTHPEFPVSICVTLIGPFHARKGFPPKGPIIAKSSNYFSEIFNGGCSLVNMDWPKTCAITAIMRKATLAKRDSSRQFVGHFVDYKSSASRCKSPIARSIFGVRPLQAWIVIPWFGKIIRGNRFNRSLQKFKSANLIVHLALHWLLCMASRCLKQRGAFPIVNQRRVTWPLS